MAALVGGSWSPPVRKQSEQEVGVGCKTSNLTPFGPNSSREASHNQPREHHQLESKGWNT